MAGLLRVLNLQENTHSLPLVVLSKTCISSMHLGMVFLLFHPSLPQRWPVYPKQCLFQRPVCAHEAQMKTFKIPTQIFYSLFYPLASSS